MSDSKKFVAIFSLISKIRWFYFVSILFWSQMFFCLDEIWSKRKFVGVDTVSFCQKLSHELRVVFFSYLKKYCYAKMKLFVNWQPSLRLIPFSSPWMYVFLFIHIPFYHRFHRMEEVQRRSKRLLFFHCCHLHTWYNCKFEMPFLVGWKRQQDYNLRSSCQQY